MTTYQIAFGKPKHIKTESDQQFYTIPIFKEQDGEKSRLTFLTDKCFSWGPQKNTMNNNSDKKEYKLPICLINTAKAGSLQMSEKEKEFFELWTMLVKKAKAFCLENKALIGRYDLEEAHLDKIGRCLYVKKKEGKKVEGVPPFLYPKIKMNTKTGEVYTLLKKGKVKKGENPNLVLESIEGQRCDLRANLHFESIFCNSQYVSIQVKVLETAIWPKAVAEPSIIPIEEVESEEEEDREFDY